jgi:Protein of Unknown function (DUF2604)
MNEEKAKHHQLELTIVVSGEPTEIEVSVNQALGTVIPRALEKTGHVGQPPEAWELRDIGGSLLDVTKKISTFGFTEETRLFLNLKVGIGG